MSTDFERVGAFHRKFGLLYLGPNSFGAPHLIDEELILGQFVSLTPVDGPDRIGEGAHITVRHHIPTHRVVFSRRRSLLKVVDGQNMIQLGLVDHPFEMRMKLLVDQVFDVVAAGE